MRAFCFAFPRTRVPHWFDGRFLGEGRTARCYVSQHGAASPKLIFQVTGQQPRERASFGSNCNTDAPN